MGRLARCNLTDACADPLFQSSAAPPGGCNGRKLRIRSIIQLQARHIATFVRGEGKPYEPWVGRW